jgi:hypothetical protein
MEPLSAPLGEERPHSPQKRVRTYGYVRCVINLTGPTGTERQPSPCGYCQQFAGEQPADEAS